MKRYLIVLFAVLMAASTALAVDPALRAGPSELNITGTPLQGATAASISVYNMAAGDVTSHYTVAATDAWMTVSSSGSSVKTNTYDTVTLSFTTTNLAEGMYEGVVTIVQTNTPIITKTIPVVLKINQDENLGISIGPSSIATDPSGIAIGDRTGRAVAIGADTIQIGAGVSSTAGTTYIRDYQLLDSSGHIPAARRAATLATTNQNFLSATGVTSSMSIVDGQIVSVTP